MTRTSRSRRLLVGRVRRARARAGRLRRAAPAGPSPSPCRPSRPRRTTASSPRRVLTDVGAVLAAADAALDPAQLPPRVDGPGARGARRAEYVRATRDGGREAADGAAHGRAGADRAADRRLAAHPAGRHRAAGRPAGAAHPRACSRTAPREPYRLWGWARMGAGVQMPADRRRRRPAARSPAPDATGLLVTPAEALQQYADVLANGDASPYAATFQPDTFRTSIEAARAATVAGGPGGRHGDGDLHARGSTGGHAADGRRRRDRRRPAHHRVHRDPHGRGRHDPDLRPVLRGAHRQAERGAATSSARSPTCSSCTCPPPAAAAQVQLLAAEHAVTVGDRRVTALDRPRPADLTPATKEERRMSQPTGPRPRLDVRGAVDLSTLNRPATPAPGTPGGLPSPGAYVVDVDQATFPDLVQSSTQHPVVVVLWAPRSEASATVAADLAALADEDAGRWLLARIDAEANPQIAPGLPGAERADGGRGARRPAAAAVPGGLPARPGARRARPGARRRRGQRDHRRAPRRNDGDPADEPEPEPELPPLHQAAYDAIERDDLAAATAAYEQALKENPRDALARAGLAQVGLLERTRDAGPAGGPRRGRGRPGRRRRAARGRGPRHPRRQGRGRVRAARRRPAHDGRAPSASGCACAWSTCSRSSAARTPA